MMTIQDHVYAAISDTPKLRREIHAEVSLCVGRTVSRKTIGCAIRRAVQNGCAVMLPSGKYMEPQDHFCESRFAKCGRGAA